MPSVEVGLPLNLEDRASLSKDRAISLGGARLLHQEEHGIATQRWLRPKCKKSTPNSNVVSFSTLNHPPCLVPFLFKPSWFARQYSDPNQTRSTLSGRIASNSRQQYWPVRRFAQLPFLLQMREALYYRTQLLKRIATHKAKSEVSHWKIMRLGVHAGRVRPVVFARAGRPQTFAARFVPQGASPNRPLPVSSLWVHWDPESFFDIFCPTSILNHLGNDLGAIFSPSKTMGSAEVIRETIEMVCRTDSMADGRPRLQSWGIPVTIGY